jgi:DNA-binding beta-propeller fold protein YncE
MSDEQAKDENRKSKFETRGDFRASISEFQSLRAHHPSLIPRHCLRLAALCLLTCFSLACRRLVPLTPYTAYVLNHQSATLAAVNLADFHVTGSLPVTSAPERVLVRPGARQLYVVSPTGKLSVAAFPHLHLVTTLDVGRSAKDLTFSPSGRAAYVLDPADHEVVFLDCAGSSGHSPEGAIPKIAFRLRLGGTLSDLALSPDGKTLMAASSSPSQITFISTETRQSLGAVEVGQSPGPMVILPDNSKVFVADTGEEKISAAAVATRKLLSHLEIGARPTALLLKPDGGEIFILAAPSSTLVIVDAFHDNLEQTFPLGGAPVAGIFRQDESVLYIANAGDGSVLALDVQNRAVLALTHVGMEPRALALTPDERLLVVADSAASSLAVLRADPTSLSNGRSLLITTVPVGASPVDVVVPDNINPQR